MLPRKLGAEGGAPVILAFCLPRGQDRVARPATRRGERGDHRGGFFQSIGLAAGATGLIYLSYLMCNVGVLVARAKGWPHQGAWFKLGSWGTIINILAIVWGGSMTINFALWKDPGLFGNFGGDLRDFTNPSLKLVTSGGQPISWLPDIPFFEASVLLILIVGVVYYLVTGQGGKRDKVEADLATGEVLVG